MIRLIVAMAVCVALQPADAPAGGRHERTIATATATTTSPVVTAAPAPGAELHAIAGRVPVLEAPAWVWAPAATARPVRQVARLWLRGQRLLC